MSKNVASTDELQAYGRISSRSNNGNIRYFISLSFKNSSDTLSRCPSKILEIEQKLQNYVQFHVDVITSTWPITDEKLKEIKAKTTGRSYLVRQPLNIQYQDGLCTKKMSN